MDSLNTGAPSRRRGTYLNGALTVNAVLLGLLLVGNMSTGRPSASIESTALAQPPDEVTGGLISAAEQRKQILAELQNISGKMAALDARLKGPLTVKVVEMPKENGKDASKPK